MDLNGKKVGIAVTGSFCTFEKTLLEVEKLKKAGAELTAIFSDNTQKMDTRFGTAEEFANKMRELTEKEIVTTIKDVEPLGPKNMIDILVIAPCTGNTLAKLANGITDTPVLMAAKGHLRGGKPLVIAVSTNDGLGMNFKNIGLLMNSKNIYFVPFGQDSPFNKPNSLVAHMDMIQNTLENALDGKQLQPVIE